MKKVKNINMAIEYLDNGGFIVTAVATIGEPMADENITEVGTFPGGLAIIKPAAPCKPMQQLESKFYAPDSQNVGMIIQEIIDNATIEAAKE